MGAGPPHGRRHAVEAVDADSVPRAANASGDAEEQDANGVE